MVLTCFSREFHLRVGDFPNKLYFTGGDLFFTGVLSSKANLTLHHIESVHDFWGMCHIQNDFETMVGGFLIKIMFIDLVLKVRPSSLALHMNGCSASWGDSIIGEILLGIGCLIEMIS